MRRSTAVGSAPNAETAVLVRLAGRFTVAWGGRPLAAAAIAGKARTLLQLLTVQRGRTVTTDDIVWVLWAAHPPKRPVENVATLVSRLRRVLGHDAVVGGRTGYRLGSAPAVLVDVDQADASVVAAEEHLAAGEPAAAERAAARALEVLGDGQVLVEEPYADWAERVRTEAAMLVRRARHGAAAAALECGAPARARAPAEAAIAVDPLDEAACRLLMRAHAAAGEPALALRAYERLRHALAAELGADPAPQTRMVHLAVLQGFPAPRRAELVGRAAERACLSEAWTGAMAGRSGVLLVAGEAGIGKSSLVRELARLAASTGGSVLTARCEETERSLFLQPFVDALRPQISRPAVHELSGRQAAALAALVPEAAPALGSPPSEACIDGDEHWPVYVAVAAFLQGLTVHAPVLLILDDLHNAGPATVELVHHLAGRTAHARVLIVGTVRPEQGAEVLSALAGVAGRIDLGPLPRDAVADLAAAAGQRAAAARIYHVTGGQTQFVVELLRGLATGDTGVPEPVRSAVLTRVRRTGAWTERLLRAAATRGLAFRPAAVAELVGLPPGNAVPLWERALQARLVVATDGEYRFANPLIHQVLSATTPTREVFR